MYHIYSIGVLGLNLWLKIFITDEDLKSILIAGDLFLD